MNKPDVKEVRDKFSLRDYLKTIDFRNPETLTQKADEIMANMRRAMKRYLELPTDDSLRRYYEPAIKLMEDAYTKKDFKTEFPNSIDFMICSVDED